MKVKNLLAGLCALALLLTACQASPKDSLVVHKNMESLISEAQTESEGKADAETIREEVSEGERYQTVIENESLGVRVSVDAEVEVPDVDTLNIYRVRQVPFSAEFVEKVRQALVGDEQLYDMSALSTPTRSVIEERIAEGREALRNYETEMRGAVDENGDPLYTEEEIGEALAQAEWEYVGRWEEAYESAPQTVEYSGYAIDGTLRPVRAWYAENPEQYQYYEDLMPEGDLLDGVTDGSDGVTKILKVVNSADYSNWLAYMARSDKAPYPKGGGARVPSAALDTGTYDAGGQPQNPNLPENFLPNGFGWNAETKFVPLEGDSVTLSEEEAVGMAEAFLEKIGLSDFVYCEGGLYNEYASDDDFDWQTDTVTYRRYYVLHFFRSVDGVPLTQSSGTKYSETGEDKVIWPGETVEFKINDGGIVCFGYYSPVRITDTVVEGAAMKPFSEIRDIFESMVGVVNTDEEARTAITVDRVRLSYSRVSEPDSGETGLIVPVWSFEGDRDFLFAAEHMEWSEQDVCFLNVNAVDGSVIVPELGY